MLFLFLKANLTCMQQILGTREMCIIIKAIIILNLMPQHHVICTYKENCGVYLHIIVYVVIYNNHRCH